MLKCAGLLAAMLAANVNAADVSHTYIVRLHGAPLLEHARERAEQSGLTRSFGEKAGVRRELETADSAEYLHQLDISRGQVLEASSAALGRALQPRHVFRHATNGIALTLSDAEAAVIAKVPGVAAIHRERRLRLLTDAGPQWIGADQLWNGQIQGVAKTKGEGVVIGIVDTGVNPAHPSFAAQGPDGYAITNPRGHFYGLCTTGEATCNNKLIGIYDFTDEGTSGVDSVGHGSHVTGIAAGNAITDALQGHTVALQRQVSGVAPHANVIMYKACVNKTASNPDGGCAESDLVAALDQATADGVDVINYSIGGDAVDPYALLDAGGNDAASMFQARAAGIVVVVAAGNDGPGPHSVDEPGNVPWVISVANASHNRRFANSIGDFSGETAAPAGTLNGQGYTAGYGPAAIVYAGDYGNALCGIGDTEGTAPTGASNPFAANTFHGEIVVCDRGTYARVEKGYNVLHAGAGGYVLANTAADGESIVSDDHFLPAVHLGYDEGAQLKNWLITPGTHTGKIAGVSAALDNSFGDILEASSSRGPTGFGVLKPDITAPGTNILSAAQTGSGEALLTGTSMASPHVAGAAALVIAAHPQWSPAQVESALIGTALAGSVRKEDAATPGTPLDAGAGRVQPAKAAKAGLYLPLSAADIRAQDPASGGKPQNLNRAGIESESCFGQCSFARTVADMSGGGTWQVSVTASDGAHVTVAPNQFTLAPGASQTLNISVDVSDPRLPGSWVNGRIVLHKSTGGQGANDTALPLTVYSSSGGASDFRELTTGGPDGSVTLQLGGFVGLPEATFTATNLVPATLTNMNLSVDTNSDDVYSTFPGTGKQFVLFPNTSLSSGFAFSAWGSEFVVEVTGSNAPTTTLYAGIDYNGDGQPEFAEQLCAVSSVAGSSARCVVDLRDVESANTAPAVSVWALVDIPKSNAAGNYAVTLSSGIPDAYGIVPGYFGVVGPGHVEGGANFPVRLYWGEGGSGEGGPAPIVPGVRYYGAVLVDDAGYVANAVDGIKAGRIGFVPFSLTRASGSSDTTDALESGMNNSVVTSGYALAPDEALTHHFIDVPGSGNLMVSTSLADGSGGVEFYVVRSDFPAVSASPSIDPAPAMSSTSPKWVLAANQPEMQVSVPVNAGRWYVHAHNFGGTTTQFSQTLQLTPSNTVTHPAPGAYYNPQRSGHGVFLSQGGGNQAAFWYTYQEDGTPVWYQAFAPQPATTDAAWTAPLARITWDGAAVNATTTVGDVILTPISATEFMFSWHLYGQSGSEHFVLLGDDECVNLNGAQANLTGLWYAPAQSGYGMDALALPQEQFDAFYFYDGLGQPVWAAADAEPFAPNTTLPVLQYQGFCPLCAYTPPTTTAIGTLTTSFASALAGSYSTALTLAPPLSGTWNINQPIARLTGKTTCPP